MKLAVAWITLLLALISVASAAAPVQSRRPRRIEFSGREYVQLNDWARANRFTIQWLDRDKRLSLSNHAARILLVMNSREARINGVQVMLLFPVFSHNGNARISQLDIKATLMPVLSPPANRPGIKIKTICLDPGHGGSDPGFRTGHQEEQKYTLLLAQEVRDLLLKSGFQVVLTRTSDKRVDLPMRPAIARRRKADLFLSLHFNSTETSRDKVRGVEVFCCTPAGATSTNARGEGDTRWVTGNSHDEKNMLLAFQLQKTIVRELAAEDRGVRRARFQVLREAAMPAVLIEGGFMSHPTEGAKILDPTYRRQLAKAIVDGILAYRKAIKG